MKDWHWQTIISPRSTFLTGSYINSCMPLAPYQDAKGTTACPTKPHTSWILLLSTGSILHWLDSQNSGIWSRSDKTWFCLGKHLRNLDAAKKSTWIRYLEITHDAYIIHGASLDGCQGPWQNVILRWAGHKKRLAGEKSQIMNEVIKYIFTLTQYEMITVCLW